MNSQIYSHATQTIQRNAVPTLAVSQLHIKDVDTVATFTGIPANTADFKIVEDKNILNIIFLNEKIERKNFRDINTKLAYIPR